MLGEIIELAHKISAEKQADVFIRYSGHIQGIEVDIHLDGWRTNNDATWKKSLSLKRDTELAFEETLQTLRDIYADQPPVQEIGRCDFCKRAIYTNEPCRNFKSGTICEECFNTLKSEE